MAKTMDSGIESSSGSITASYTAITASSSATADDGGGEIGGSQLTPVRTAPPPPRGDSTDSGEARQPTTIIDPSVTHSLTAAIHMQQQIDNLNHLKHDHLLERPPEDLIPLSEQMAASGEGFAVKGLLANGGDFSSPRYIILAKLYLMNVYI
jgi:hypothetical protein